MTTKANGAAAAERSADFAVGDVVLLSQKRQGTIRFIGNIDGIGSQIFGIELKETSKETKKQNGNGSSEQQSSQDGTYGGKQYFECEPGRGTFVTRSKITTRLKSGSSKSKDKLSVSKKKNGKKKKPISPRAGSGSTRGRDRNGKNGGTSPRPGSGASRKKVNGSKTPGKQKPTVPVDFNIPEEGSLEDKISFIMDKLKDTKSQFKGRQKMLKALNDIMENEEKIDDDLINKTIQDYRKPFMAQLGGKRVTIHKYAMETLVVIAKTKSEQFSSHAAFYIKKLVGHCKHPDPKSVASAEKSIQAIIKETPDKSPVAAALIQAATKAKNKIVRKHAWQFLNETLKYYLPAKGQSGIFDRPPKDILDALAQGLKQGLAESDRHTKDEAMHVLNTLGLFDETRAERLISKLPQTQRRAYQKKFNLDTKPSKRPSSSKASTTPTKNKPKRPNKTQSSRSVSRERPNKKQNGKNPKDKGSNTPKKNTNGKNTTKGGKGDGKPGKGKKGGNKGGKKGTNDNKTETNGSVTTEVNGTVANGNSKDNNNNENKDESTEVSDELAKKRADRKNRGRNANSLMGSKDDPQIAEALDLDLPGGDDSEDSGTEIMSPTGANNGSLLSPTNADDNDEDDNDIDGDGDINNEDGDNDEGDDEPTEVDGNDDDSSSTTSSDTIVDHDPNTAIELIESFLELKDPQINWKMIEFLSKDNMTHLLMSYISRMPGGPKIWTENLDVDFDMIIPPTKPLSSEEETEIRATRLSYSLMRILSNEHAAETVKSFLLRKCQEICLHALAVFHPRSKGNVYHGRVVLEILLNDWPKSFMGALANQKHIQKLLKCALFRNLHQGNLNSFFLDLICYRPNPKTAQLQPIKRKLLKLFSDWQFMEYLLDAACSPKHGDDVATKYATFFIDLVARSASIPEAAELFHGHEHLIIDSFMNALLDDDQNRTLWHRIICGQTLVQFLDISSRPNIMDPAAAMAGVMGIVPEPSPNVLHLMFEKSLERLHTFIPRMCNAIQNPKEKLDAITLSGGIVEKPFGQVRLNCLELLTVSADFAQFGCGKVLGKLTNDFWKSILDMAFIHETNNMYLCHFRRLIHLSMIFRRRFLKFLFVKCNMLERFIEFYQTPNKNRSTLHGYILQMLWDIYHHDQRDDEEQKQENNDEPKKDDDNDSNSSVIVNDGDDNNKTNNGDNEEGTKDTADKPDVNGENDNENGEDKKTEDEFTEEDLILRPNFSRDPEDQWDIVSFFRNNESWKIFEPILTQQIEIQNNADTQLPNPMGPGGDGGQLDALLQNLLGSSNGMGDDDNGEDNSDEDSSSDDSSEED